MALNRKTCVSMLLGALAAGGLMLGATSAAAQGCSRDALLDTADDYVDAQEAGMPLKVHMGLWADYNEQMVQSTMSTGVISKPMKVDFYRVLADTVSCSVFVETVITDPAHPHVIGAIVSQRGSDVNSFQVVYTDKVNGWLFSPANTAKYSKGENWSEIPAAERDSRETLLAAANAYLDLFDNKNVQVPWGTPCARLEGGLYTSKSAPGQPLAPTDSCNVGVPSGVKIVDRTYVVDPVLGGVSVLSHFGSAASPDFHTFRIEHGKIKYIHTITACKVLPNCGLKISPEIQARLSP